MLNYKLHHLEFEPREELQDSIKCFWYDRRDSAEEPSNFEVMPDGYAEIIFYFGSTCSVSYNGVLQPLPSPFIMGLLNQPVILNSNNRLEIIAIRCFPWTVFDLLGLPSGKGKGGVHIFEHPIAQLQSRLNDLIEANKIEEAIAQVQQFFLNAHSQIPPDSLLFKAGLAMRNAKGIIPVSEVASAAHATVRTLERNFKQSSGHSVKDVSGLMRFEQVRNHLWHFPDTNIAGLAQELGYTDQSHLSREFKRYSGTTPGAFARKAKQTISNDFVAFVQS
ncbi:MULTISPECIES: helix-turn-helix domain-containing protein [unclassified Flavobacterium]|uniref:helix-turn-helix domain-containing protein n=1 Tax=unclassified Flavobacterium TaxID=196869 RepID=UPI0012A7D23A|nr:MULTISPECIES: helix-turn-helix domain-containing protein [unclassified Flavobacterium]MBF4484896.1 AraC family transcriptional regulator [Flavobacterium sp. CSZ]QGK73697.1 helix-turn-helix domain-containing protein [Flavobacterium sp. SLB02]